MMESQLVRWLPAEFSRLSALQTAQRGATAFGIKVGGAGLALVLQVLLARMLGQAGYGEYSSVFAWLQLSLLLAQGGLSIAAVRYVAEYRTRRQPELAQGFIRRSSQIALGTSLLLAWLMWMVPYCTRIDACTSVCNFLIAGATVPVLAQFALNSAVVRGLGHSLLGMSCQLSYQLVFAAILLSCVVAFGYELSPTNALMMNLVAAVCALCVTLATRQRLSCEFSRIASPIFRTGQWLTTAIEMLFVSGITYAQMRTGVIFSSWYLDSDAIGTYAAIERMADSALLGTMSVELLIAPRLAELYAQGRCCDLARKARGAAWGSSIIALAIVAGIVLFGRPLLRMFGDEFVSGYLALVVMLLGIGIRAICSPAGLLLCMTGHQRDTIGASAVSLFLNAVISMVLIPRFGILGTTTSFTITMFVWNFSMVGIARWRLGIWSCIGRIPFAGRGADVFP